MKIYYQVQCRRRGVEERTWAFVSRESVMAVKLRKWRAQPC